ncbi:hypothetical protein [Allocoleopsis franciscana]|uniref:Uncharacterized protein n=1 Tax=Allocoleopsis franciscana PCC 7113 TaxID=1173027 RepID=K9WGX3_9CYAN|nr:hypothetical protein [Allocoleopsis franciscana]AFZ19640.1 hypothetical protein Mic7113_3932 [Allocoleopsis franciscana PCC 7113]
MKQDKSKPQAPEIVNPSSESTLNQDAVNEVVDEYEISANLDQPTEVDPATQKELGEVERALENSVMGIEDAS